MMNLVLGAVIGTLAAASAYEVMTPRKRGRRWWGAQLAHDFKRGFLEGYRGEAREDVRLEVRAKE